MSNDDFPPPPDPSSGGPGDIPGLPNNPVEGAPTEPTQVFPAVPGGAGPTLPPTPPVAAGVPTDPAMTPEMMMAAEPPSDYELPWYRQPGQVALLVFALLAVAGLIILLIVLSGGDDDDGAIATSDDQPVSVVITRLDALEAPYTASITAIVDTGDEADAYLWVVPAEAVVGEPAVRQTDAGGRTEFRWQPSATADIESWTSSVELGEIVPADVAVGGVSAECTVDRGSDDGPAPLTVNVAFAGDDADAAGTRVATYSFPNVVFSPGDRVTCTITNNAVILETTTSTSVPEETTTTAVDTTTTLVETTTTIAATTTAPVVPPPTTPATVATTTTTTTTTTPPTTTTTTTTVPQTVVEPGSVLEFVTSRSDLSGMVDLIESAGLTDEFNDPSRTLTLFAPDNDAVSDLINDPNAPDLTDVDVLRDLVRTHVLDGEDIDETEILSRASIAVQFGGPQPIDTNDPVSIGVAEIIEFDNVVTGATIHIIDAVLEPQP